MKCGKKKYVYCRHLTTGQSTSCGCEKLGGRHDITGEKYNKLTAIKYVRKNNGGQAIWLFECDCGNKKEMLADSVIRNTVSSCGLCDLPNVGDKCGLLTVKRVIVSRNCRSHCICECKCGREKKVVSYFIKNKVILSCGRCKVSRGELSLVESLDKVKIQYDQHKSFDGCKYKNRLNFDFYLPDYNICIEFQGLQHYKASKLWGEDHFKNTRIRDQIKRDFCIQNNITLIEIPYWDIDKIDQIIQKKILGVKNDNL